MNRLLTTQVLQQETRRFHGTGGVSAVNRDSGYLPAFLDTETGCVYLARYSDGRAAPCHVLDGLPDELVLARSASGSVAAVKSSVVSGFVRAGRFYSREEAAQAVADLH